MTRASSFNWVGSFAPFPANEILGTKVGVGENVRKSAMVVLEELMPVSLTGGSRVLL